MTRKVELGAPSLTGKDANKLVAAEFGKAKYPLTVTVQNNMPRDVSFPEINLFLRHCAGVLDSAAVVIIKDHDQFQRFASDVEQVAELNGYQVALTIEEGEKQNKPEVQKTVAKPADEPK